MISYPRRPGHEGLVAEYLTTEPDQVVRTLRPVMALNEIIAVCGAVRTQQRLPQPQDLASLTDDANQALATLGKNLRGVLQPTEREYVRNSLTKLSALLNDVGGAARVEHATVVLRDLIRRPECALAAWRDLVAAVRTGQPEQTCRLRALQLREIEESLGHEWRWRAGQLTRTMDEVGLDEAEQQLLYEVDRAAQVVWFMVANADVEPGVLRIGQIQFFSHRFWPEIVLNAEMMARFPGAAFPAELTDYALKWLRPVPEHGPEDEPVPAQPGHYVYVRVELAGLRAQGRRNPWAHGRIPVEWARELVLGTVESACFPQGGSAWRLMDGYAVYHGKFDDTEASTEASADRWSHSGWFADPHDIARWNQDDSLPWREGTDQALQGLPDRFAEALAEADPAAHDALAEARWHRAVRQQDDNAQRVMLHVRAFERSLPLRGSERWNDAVQHYFRSYWALDRFNNHVVSLALVCDQLVSDLDPAARPAERFIVNSDRARFTTNLAALLEATKTLAPRVPADRPLYRQQIRALARWADDPAKLKEHLQQLEHEFDVLLKRALRQRNAVVHGRKPVPAVVATIDHFLARLSAFMVNDALQRVATGEELGVRFERHRTTAQRRMWRLDQPGSTTSHALYDKTPEDPASAPGDQQEHK